jgi:serine/threonine protein kinase
MHPPQMQGEGASAPPPMSAPLVVPCRFGRYRLTQLLATGGMAQIYLAKSFGAEGFVKPLVIKRLDPQLAADPYYTNLFVNEAKLLVTLNHGNIVPVFDFGRIGPDLFMAMEYVRGGSVHHLLEAMRTSGQALEMPLAAYIAAEVCKGLDYAHRKADEQGAPAGIVHRDIKPRNILISSEGEIKIVDFGVAKLASRMEGHGHLTGTLAYMSPEQAERQIVDPRTDIFSLGLVLYELVAMRRAYAASSPVEVLVQARQADLPALPEGVPVQMREIIRRATQRVSENRYASAHEMEQELAEYLLVARSADGIVDDDRASPGAKLCALVSSLGLATQRADTDDDAPAEPERVVIEEGSPVELAGPPDLAMIRNAAETFHSEFMTRVLIGEERVAVRRIWLVIAIVGVVAGVIGGGLLFRWLAGRGPARPRAAQPADAARVASRHPDARVAAVVRAGVDGATRAPANAAVPDDRPRPRRSRGYGYLNLNSIPWSNVSIDGQPQRPTPILQLQLPAGRHTVVLVNRERSLRKTMTVRIRRGDTTWKVVQLR